MRNSLAKALSAAALLTLLPALPAHAAEKKADPKPKPFTKKIVLVVDCVRRTDVKAARDFIAYLTRRLPAKPDHTTASRDTQFIAAASLSSARKVADREKAIAIVHVKILKRAPPARGWDPEMQANCSVLLPTASKASRRVSWKVKRAAILPPQQKGGAAGLVLLEAPDAFGDPGDFIVLRQGITRLTYDAALDVAMPRMRKAPREGETVKATVTNNTLLDVVAFDVSMASNGASSRFSYSGNPLPPGKSDVTLKAEHVPRGRGGRAVPNKPARVEYVRFADTAGMKK